MDKESILQNFGLTDAEVKVYLALLESEATASKISKKTGTNRTFTYDRLKKLSDMGLVSNVIKDDKKYFKAARPSQLLSILKDREKQIKEIIPELERLKRHPNPATEVEVYTTIKGVKTALNLMLSQRQEIYLHGTLKKFQEIMPTYFDIWNKRRIDQKINMKILSSEEINLELAESDILSEEEHTATSNFYFGTSMIFIMWSTYPVAILIKSKEISENNKSFFNTIWDREVKIYSGINGIRRAYNELITGGVKTFRGYGYSKQLADVYSAEFSNKWHMERLRKGIDNNIISYDDEESRGYFEPRIKKVDKFEVRYLSKDIQGPVCVTFSEKMIVNFIYTEKEFKVILTKNKETINVYRKHFEYLWSKAKN